MSQTQVDPLTLIDVLVFPRCLLQCDRPARDEEIEKHRKSGNIMSAILISMLLTCIGAGGSRERSGQTYLMLVK